MFLIQKNMTRTFKIFFLSLVIILSAVVATTALKTWNKVYGKSSQSDVKTPAFQTAYTRTESLTTVDFEKAATAAVPSVVHIKTIIKGGEVAGNHPQQNPLGDEGNDF